MPGKRAASEQFHANMFLVPADLERARVERFKQSTEEKLRGIRCPEHHQAPRLRFQGTSLRDITISLSGCCARVMELANARIASAQPPLNERQARLKVS